VRDQCRVSTSATFEIINGALRSCPARISHDTDGIGRLISPLSWLRGAGPTWERPLEFIIASTKADALAALGVWGAGAAIMAGGTYVGPQIARGETAPAAVVHIGRIDELRSISRFLGAAAPLRTVATSPALIAYRGVRQAAAAVGSWQIQNIGTLGGNLCNAASVSDMAPPLLVHGATVTLESEKNGVRIVSLESFLLAENRVDRADDEIVTGFRLDPLPTRSADAFVKITCRGGMEFSTVSLAVRLTLEDDGETIRYARIAVGAMAPLPFRAKDAELALVGRSVEPAAISRAGEAAQSAASPRDDVRSSAAYRRAVLPRILDRALRACADAARAA
jgi:carbon-monoxide dehydrogenase medium subunit